MTTTGSLWAPERGFAPVGYDTHILDLAFDTPGLQTGVPIYTPALAGTVIAYAFSWVSVTTGFDGTTPKVFLVLQGSPSSATFIIRVPVTALNSNGTGWYSPKNMQGTGTGQEGGSVVLTGTTPIVVGIDDGAGGATGSTVGACRVLLATSSALT